jgi:hypothetical protein
MDDDNDNTAVWYGASVSVQRQVRMILEDVDSDFSSRWSGEIHSKEMERIRALACDGMARATVSTVRVQRVRMIHRCACLHARPR